MNPSALRTPARLQKPHHHSAQRAQNLHLPGLPRFHPANFPDSPTAISPLSAVDSPQPPTISPRQQYRQVSDAQQRHHYLYPRELAAYSRPGGSPLSASSGLRTSRPNSPRLDPLGSPGPVTPFELEDGEGYLSSTSRPAEELSAMNKEEFLKTYARKDSQLPRGDSPYCRSGSGVESRNPSM